ncbi:MAG: nitroreductase family protein [Rikenellaceae bacterium]
MRKLRVLAAVAVAIFTMSACCSGGAESAQDVALENIMTRSSVRSYTTQAVEAEKVDLMLKAAMAAPTAGNKQPWQFVVIENREVLDTLPTIIGGAKMAARAQLAIAVCGDTPRSMGDYWIQDCSAATQNILLAAHSMGLGAVWCGAHSSSDDKRIEPIRELLGLPENVTALSVIVIGYPDSEPTIKDKWDAKKVKYLK